ncbi:MAG TPA: outer membrane protein transport protein [Planctomycetota bacterium]
MKIRPAAGMVLAWSVLAGALGAQIGGEPTGSSALGAGRAGAGGAAADSVLDAQRNPASLSFLFDGGNARKAQSGALHLEARGFAQTFTGRSRGGERFRDDSKPAGGPWLGWATRIDEDLVAALTLSPTFAGAIDMRRQTRLNVGTPTRSREIAHDNGFLQVALQPGIAWRASPTLALGAGVSLRHTRLSLQSATEVDTRSTFKGDSGLGQSWGGLLSGPPFNIAKIQTEYDGDANQDLAAALHLGLAWQASSDLRVALWYRSPSTKGDLEGAVDVNLDPDMGPILKFFNLDGMSRYDFAIRGISFPQQLGVAMSQRLSERDRAHFDFFWTDWSSTFDGLTAELSNPSNRDFKTLIGGNGATDFDLDLRWRDVYALALGLEHDLQRSITVRAGVGWSSDPTAGSVAPGTHVLNRWHVGTGASFWNGLGGDWHFALTVALPSGYRNGENAVLEDFSNDRYRSTIYAVAVAYSLHF